MNIAIELLENKISSVEDGIRAKEADLAIERDSLKKLKEALSILSREIDTPSINKTVFKMPSIDKEVVYAGIVTNGIFIHRKEVHKKVYDKDMYGSDTVTFGARLSNVLSDLRKEGKLVNYSPNNAKTNMYWGLPEWMNNNEPKPEFAKDIK